MFMRAMLMFTNYGNVQSAISGNAHMIHQTVKVKYIRRYAQTAHEKGYFVVAMA